MKSFLMFFWLLVITAIPLGLLVTGIISYRNNANVRSVLARLAAAFITYVFITVGGVALTVILLFGAAGAHAKAPSKMTVFVTGMVVLLIYGLCGGLICWLTQQSLIKLPREFTSGSRKIP